MSNTEIRLVKAPTQNYPQNDEKIFQIRNVDIPKESQIPQGHLLLKIKFISVDAANRIWISGVKSYRDPVKAGDVMQAGAVAQVIYSKGKAKVGDLVFGTLQWKNYVVTPEQNIQVLPKSLKNPESVLGVLGISGLTAHIGLFTIGKLQKGQTVVVSAAAGAVGQIVVQLAKNHGCIVCGIAGSEQKCQYVRSIGADSTINYQTTPVQAQLKRLYPKGIDVYFDNVGGQTLDAVLMNIKQKSRIVLCGSISTYYGRNQPYKLKNYPRLIIKKCIMEGFIYYDHKQEIPKAIQQIQNLIQSNKLKTRVDWVYGLEQCPNALRKLLMGKNNGKVIVSVQKNSIKAKL